MAVQHRLLAFLHAGDLDDVASAAYREGVNVLARAGASGLAKSVTVQSLPAYRHGAVTVIPFRWLATGLLHGAFPVLDANLELAATGAHTTITIIGSYRPPLGKLGEVLDQLLLKTVARATIRHFLDQLAEVATRIVPAPAAEHSNVRWPEAELP